MKGNATGHAQRSRTARQGVQSKESFVRPSSLDFVKVEKNLASIGFFTPSHKRISGAKKKTIVWNRQSEGQRVEVSAVILPSAVYGLPITSDQDKYLAFQKILADIRRQKGEVKNPIGFTTAELLRVLGLKLNAGKNYDDVVEWGKRMTLTGMEEVKAKHPCDRGEDSWTNPLPSRRDENHQKKTEGNRCRIHTSDQQLATNRDSGHPKQWWKIA